jgi:hypothetical protein
MVLMTGSCSVCKQPLPGMASCVQFSDHYYCECEYGRYVCPACYKKGHNKCPKCGKSLKFHSAAATSKSAAENGIMFL